MAAAPLGATRWCLGLLRSAAAVPYASEDDQNYLVSEFRGEICDAASVVEEPLDVGIRVEAHLPLRLLGEAGEPREHGAHEVAGRVSPRRQQQFELHPKGQQIAQLPVLIGDPVDGVADGSDRAVERAEGGNRFDLLSSTPIFKTNFR